MVAPVFTDEELEGLRRFPEIGRDELFRFFTLTPADVAFVDPGRDRGPADRLGVAAGRAAPRHPDVIRSYGQRAKTRTEHLRLAAQYLGWRTATTLELKELDEFLLARAMEHDSPTLLFRLVCEYLISAKVIRPGPVTVVKRVAHAREVAQRETFDRLAHELTDERRAALDGLLVTDPAIGMTRLRWLGTGPVEASPAAVKAEIAKLAFLRGMDAHTLDLPVLPAERRPRTRVAETSSMTESKPKLGRASEPVKMPAVTAMPASISIHPMENCSRRTARWPRSPGSRRVLTVSCSQRMQFRTEAGRNIGTASHAKG